MDYHLYRITTDREWADILTAFLAGQPFDTFQETDKGLDAYLPAHLDDGAVAQFVDGLKERFPFSYQVETIGNQNWNQLWESHFETVLVPGFCGIRADFHPPFDGVQHEIIINPKMAFGTGHHATTYMVMQAMEGLDFSGKSVLDYGCGTGILAILAAKLGSDDLDAIDIEEAAYHNALENIQRNDTPHIRCHKGLLQDLPMRQYDSILANINRNVILESLPTLYGMLAPGGVLVTSGYVEADKELMAAAHSKHGFFLSQTLQNGNWLASLAYRRY